MSQNLTYDDVVLHYLWCMLFRHCVLVFSVVPCRVSFVYRVLPSKLLDRRRSLRLCFLYHVSCHVFDGLIAHCLCRLRLFPLVAAAALSLLVMMPHL